MIKLSDFVFQYLSSTIGVKHVFLLSGGGAMHLVDSLGKTKGLEYIACLHEQAAVISACAYAQYTNNLGVALVTTGPGGTNAITGVAAAWTDSIPLLVISGQVKTADMSNSMCRTLGYQEIDIVPVVKSITKYAVTIKDPNDILYCLEEAVYNAKSGRPGPVWIDIPLDIQSAMIDESKLDHFVKEDEEPKPANVPPEVGNVIWLINNSKHPVILAGYGIKLANAQDDFKKLVESLNIPVLTTWKAADLLPEDHRLYFGRPGAVGQRYANFMQQNADLIICIGTRLDLGQIGYSYDNFAKNAKKILVDVDRSELNKLKFDIDVTFNDDAGKFIKELLRWQGTKTAMDDSWLSQGKLWKEKYPIMLPEYYKRTKYVSTYVLVDILSNAMKDEDILTPGSSGACSDITMQTFRVKGGQRIINMPGLGAMGFGIPTAIGACIASDKKRTICINGDGGFQLNIQDLETIRRLKLPIKFFVLNNNGYGSIRNTQNNYFKGHLVACDSTSGVTLPSLEKVAEAYGMKFVKIKTQKNITGYVKVALSAPGPVLCKVMVDPKEQIMPRVTSKAQPDGKMITAPLEDLWPFLDRKEFEENMIREGK